MALKAGTLCYVTGGFQENVGKVVEVVSPFTYSGGREGYVVRPREPIKGYNYLKGGNVLSAEGTILRIHLRPISDPDLTLSEDTYDKETLQGVS